MSISNHRVLLYAEACNIVIKLSFYFKGGDSCYYIQCNINNCWEYEHINRASSLGGGIVASEIVSLTMFIAQSKNERRQNPESLFFITQCFTDRISFISPMNPSAMSIITH